MKFGFTKDREHYTHDNPPVEGAAPTWTVIPIPESWRAFGRPARYGGEDGFMKISKKPSKLAVRPPLRKSPLDSGIYVEKIFYPLRILHTLSNMADTKKA